MEFVEDDHPADYMLAYTAHYKGGYVDMKDVPLTVPQKMPATAAVPFAAKIKALEHSPKVGDAHKAPLVGMKLDKDAASVEYVKDVKTRRQLYEMTMGAKMKRGSPPEELDTAEVKLKYLHSGIGANALGKDDMDNERFQQLADEWNLKSLIWVATTEPGRIGATFYSHVGRPQKFHHSSFKSGGALIGAGEWIVESGALKKISGNSGHYQPTLHELHRAVMYMEPAWGSDTQVMLFNKKANNWEYVPVSYFKSDPSGGGKYITHPLSS